MCNSAFNQIEQFVNETGKIIKCRGTNFWGFLAEFSENLENATITFLQYCSRDITTIGIIQLVQAQNFP